jgi:hypothetical protein
LAAYSPLPTKRARVLVDPGGVGKAGVLQERSAAVIAPRRRKKRTRPMIDGIIDWKKLKNEPPPRKRSRVDPVLRYTVSF